MARAEGLPSERELARQLGISHVTLMRARTSGRVSRSTDVNVLRAELARNTDPSMQRSKVKPKPTASLQSHRARYEAARAREKELKVRVLEGSLVDRQKAASLFFEAGKRAREAWEQWPARVAAMVAAELGSDPHTVDQVLTRHVKEHLRKIPQDLKAEFR